MSKAKPWKVLSSEEVFNARFFKITTDECQLSDGSVMPRYYKVHFPSDWVQVVALTPDKKMIMLEQYRHGVGEIVLEVPGGAFSRQDQGDPLKAGARELLEETGYTSENVVYLASISPNPALQDNRLHTLVAFDCKKIAEPQLDEFEELSVCIKSVPEVLQTAQQGKLNHALVIASLFLALPHLSPEAQAALTKS